jgi:hypothetical protein
MGHKGVIDCCRCDNDAFFEGQCGNDIIKDTGYHQLLGTNKWLCPDCIDEAEDISLKHACEMVFELAQGNMIEPRDAEGDPDLCLEHHKQEKAMHLVRELIDDLDESDFFHKKLKEDMSKGGKE